MATPLADPMVSSTQRPLPRPRTAGWFYTGVALVAIALSVAAFAPSIVDPGRRRGPLTPLVVAHASFMAAWLALFFAQARLVARGRVAAHRSLGVSSIPVGAGIVGTGYAATIAMARRGFDLSGDLSRPPASAMDQIVFQLGALLLFTGFVALALLLRRRPEAHKRLMTLATLQVLMTAPLAHLVGHVGLPGLILPAWGVAVALSLMAHDRRSRGRIHPASLCGGLGLVVVNNLQFAVIGPSRTWQQLVTWLAS
jgi:hypothetical protein